MKHNRLKQFFQDFYLALILLFLYIPIVTMIVLSFNNTKSRTVWGGFTPRWYTQMFQDSAIMNALNNTLLIAFASALIATVIGTIAAIGIHNMGRRAKAAYLTVNNIPMSSSDTIMGVTFMLLFAAIGLDKGYLTLILAHVTFCTPYVVLNVMPKLRQLDKNAYEAALDLGATPHQALHKVILPEIMPGIVTGAIMAFTMSIDDFVVSYFTAGTTSQPLSVVIYSMTRHRMTPKINAISTILFLIVLALLIVINMRQSRDEKRREAARRKGASLLSGCVSSRGESDSADSSSDGTQQTSGGVVNVYNWGEYIDTDLIDRFEEETGIKVIYNTFDSNENLYSRIQTTSYDVIIPSDYAISRFIDEDMLQPLNYDHIPNMKLIDEKYTHLDFDPEQKYSVPYTWGVVGIVYNTRYVDEADIGSWDLLWNPKYTNRTAMFNNSRDALGIALMYLGYSLNTTDKDELREAADLIIAGKPVYQGIWMDQILEKLPSEEIVAAPYYNGDAVTMIDENPDLAFYVPKEGTNLFVDAMCIPKNAKNVSGAEKFINFMCSTEAAMANWEYVGYSSPQTEVYNELDEEITSDPLYFPDITQYPTEAYTNLPTEINQYYNDLWVDILT